MRRLTSFPPGTTVYVVEAAGNMAWMDQVQESSPAGAIRSLEPGAPVTRPPDALGEVLETVVTDADGVTTVTTTSGDAVARSGLPSRRFFALGLVDGQWRRVSFAESPSAR